MNGRMLTAARLSFSRTSLSTRDDRIDRICVVICVFTGLYRCCKDILFLSF
jgi:hypothetical protein